MTWNLRYRGISKTTLRCENVFLRMALPTLGSVSLKHNRKWCSHFRGNECLVINSYSQLHIALDVAFTLVFFGAMSTTIFYKIHRTCLELDFSAAHSEKGWTQVQDALICSATKRRKALRHTGLFVTTSWHAILLDLSVLFYNIFLSQDASTPGLRPL